MKITDIPPSDMQFIHQAKWDVKESAYNKGGFTGVIYLITPEQLKKCPKGTRLYSISGESAIVGQDKIDDDTRFGHLAYGFSAEAIPFSQKPLELKNKPFTGRNL